MPVNSRAYQTYKIEETTRIIGLNFFSYLQTPKSQSKGQLWDSEAIGIVLHIRFWSIGGLV